ncbi:MAG: copper chaperone PCu(A)C [Pseudomonadales bacterium]|nr:copper chaperone PCu(A)C [Pseudomonadales bacterium]MCP5213849.1 copper chaperone PCu(A)C [Pseudomonadales bacterium]
MEQKKRAYFTLIFAAINILFITNLAASTIEVEQASARESLPGMQSSAAYMVIKNTSERDLRLVGATSARMVKIEIHQHRQQGDMTAMRKVESVVIPARGEFVFQSGGYHLMLMGIEQPLMVGEELSLQLVFEDGTTLDIKVPVVSITAPAGHHGMTHSKQR